MNVRYLKRAQINTKAWDACIAQSVQHLVYAYSWYLDEIAFAWGGIVLEKDGGYLAVMPVPYRTKLGLNFVRQPDFCPQLGLFSVSEVATEQIFGAFLRELQRRFRWVASYRFNEHNETELTFPENLTRRLCENHVLPLSQSYDSIQQQWATDRKTNLKRARNTGWKLAESSDMQTLIQLHRDHNEAKATQEYQQLDLSLYDRLTRVVEQLKLRGKARIWFTELNGQAEAGGLFVFDRDRIIYLFNAASATGRKKQGRLWMIDLLMQEFAGKAMAFDFESPGLGADSVKAYYKSFGSDTRQYTEISYNRMPPVMRLLQTARRRLLLIIFFPFRKFLAR